MLPAFISLAIITVNELYFRFILSTRKIPINTFITIIIPVTFLLMMPGVPFFFRLPPAALEPLNLFALFGLCLCAYLYNVLFCVGIRHQKMEQFEPIFQTTAIFSILIAFILFPDERNPFYLLLGLIAVGAILSLHIRKHHFEFSKYSVIILGASFIWAIHTVLAKQLLYIYNPFTLLFFRLGIVALGLQLFVKVGSGEFGDQKFKPLLIVSLLGVVEWVTRFWAIQTIGVVLTTLVLSMASITTIWGSNLVLKERVHLKNVVVTLVILGCVSASMLI